LTVRPLVGGFIRRFVGMCPAAVLLMGGTLTIAIFCWLFRRSVLFVALLGLWGWNGSGWLVGVVGALLGPERTGSSSLVGGGGVVGCLSRPAWFIPLHVLWWVGWCCWLLGLLFEICIVDASIFYSWFCVF